MATTLTNGKFRTEKRAPEGGWGYFVGIGMALPFACIWGTMSAFGLMFNDFLMNLGKGTSTVTIITGTNFCATSFAALFASTFYKKYSLRAVGLFGSMFYFLGNLMIVFATDVAHLIISYGIMQGIGVGLMLSCAYTTFNHYFVEKRVFMLSVAKSLMGVGVMMYPILVQALMDSFGFRGAMAILAAINAHAILGMVVMHPIKWHYKVIKIPIDETEPLMDPNGNNTDLTIAMPLEDISESGKLPDVQKSKTRFSVPNDGLTENNDETVRDIKPLKERRKSTLQRFNEIDIKQRNRAFSIMSLGDFDGGVILAEESKPEKTVTCKAQWKKVVDFLDLTLLKDWVYVNIVFGISFALYADNLFFTLSPMYLLELGFEKADTAMVIAAGSAADLSSRVCLAIMSLFFQINSRYLYLAGAIMIILLRFVFYNIFDFTGMVIITAMMGFFRTWVHVPLALVLADHLPKDRFASGYGLYMFIQGNLSFCIGPFIGIIRDITQSYKICFHSLTFLMTLCVIPWTFEILYFRFRNKKPKN